MIDHTVNKWTREIGEQDITQYPKLHNSHSKMNEHNKLEDKILRNITGYHTIHTVI